MIAFLKECIGALGSALLAPIPLSECTVVRDHKLKKHFSVGADRLTAVMIALPYYTDCKEKNISRYAVPRDYHLCFGALFNAILPQLKKKYPEYSFCGFADDSPIDEIRAAAAAGLGIIGDNGLLITERYSSFVFLGELITDMPLPEAKAYPIKRCEGCGLCRSVCPKEDTGTCLSALTQKKGALSPEEERAMLKGGSVWGCDLCQEVCPHTKRALESGEIYTDIEFFKVGRISVLTKEILDRMSDADFSERAYSWRKRETVGRNLDLFERADKCGGDAPSAHGKA